MPKQLTAQSATITTAAVEVKTLTVSGKQVTLAVFRQLREEPLIADDGTLNGVPWGYVNYHPDKCEGLSRRHKHYVWQHGAELLRSRVTMISDYDAEPGQRSGPPAFWARSADRLLVGRVREWLHGRIEHEPLRKASNRYLSYESECRLGGPFGFAVLADASAVALDAANKQLKVSARLDAVDEANVKLADVKDPWSDEKSRQDAVARAHASHDAAREELATAIAALDEEVDAWGLSYSELKAALTRDARAEADRRSRHRENRAALADLPQLFIAV